jgi:ABC-type multidrug transport system ATPase subunit
MAPDAVSSGSSGAPGSGAAARLQRVTKRFGSVVAVDAVTLTIEVGVVFGLIGPNGAGKTTTFSMLAGYLWPSEGTAEVLGFRPTAVDSLRGRLGVLPQDALLPQGDTVGEFLMHMARLQEVPPAKAEEVARHALEEVAGRDWWRQRCGALSHGMAKRVGLAQAFLGDPEIVLLDEPTAGLDPKVAFEVRELIASKRGRATIVVSSHNLHELEALCDYAAILDRGRLMACSRMTDLTAANEQIRIQFAPGTKRGSGDGQVPLGELRGLTMVKTVDFDDEGLELQVTFERKDADAETVIGAVLWVLLQKKARISSVSKGRGLEQRVMDLT